MKKLISRVTETTKAKKFNIQKAVRANTILHNMI